MLFCCNDERWLFCELPDVRCCVCEWKPRLCDGGCLSVLRWRFCGLCAYVRCVHALMMTLESWMTCVLRLPFSSLLREARNGCSPNVRVSHKQLPGRPKRLPRILASLFCHNHGHAINRREP